MTTDSIPIDLVTPLAERRSSVRKPLALRISLYYDRLGLVSCRTRDLSLEGMLLDTGRIRLTSNARVEVVLTQLVEDFNDPIRVSADVSRVNESLAALAFRDLDIGTFRRLKAVLNQYP